MSCSQSYPQGKCSLGRPYDPLIVRSFRARACVSLWNPLLCSVPQPMVSYGPIASAYSAVIYLIWYSLLYYTWFNILYRSLWAPVSHSKAH